MPSDAVPETGVLILSFDPDADLKSTKELIETYYGVAAATIYSEPLKSVHFRGPQKDRLEYQMSVAFSLPNESHLRKAVGEVRGIYSVRDSVFFKNSADSKYWEKVPWTNRGGD
jgi:hypothetical protein